MNARFNFDSTHACKRQDVAVMDHVLGSNPDHRPIVNRFCLTCGTHWYGDAHNAVFAIPQKQWDRWMREPEA